MLALILALLLVPVLLPAVTGLRAIEVGGGSMSPTLRVGDIILVDTTIAAAPGAIVTASRPDGGLVTHRVVRVLDDGSLQLKGDANTVDDPHPVAAAAVVGTVVMIVTQPWAGIIRGSTGLAGRLCLAGVLLLLLLPLPAARARVRARA